MPLSRDQKAALFGRVRVPERTGDHVPNAGLIERTAAGPGVHLVVFCKGCGLPNGVQDEALAACFFSIGGIERPEPLDGKFMQVDQCPVCTCMREPWDGMVLRDVSELQ